MTWPAAKYTVLKKKYIIITYFISNISLTAINNDKTVNLHTRSLKYGKVAINIYSIIFKKIKNGILTKLKIDIIIY